MKIRNFYAINIMKFICVILIISMYTSKFSSLSNTMDFVVVQLFAKIAFPFFFIYASFFFFRKIDFSIPLSDHENKKKLYSYLINIIKIYVIWTVLYLPFTIFNWIEEGFTIMKLIDYLLNFLFVGSYPHLWIFPALLFAIVLVYYLLQRLKTSELFVVAFICYLIGMLINVYGSFLLEISIIANIIEVYENIFSTTVNGLFYAFIFVLLGMKLSLKRIPLKISNIIVRLTVFIIFYIIEVSLLSWLGYANINTYMYLSLLPLTYFLFLLLMQYQDSKQNQFISQYAMLMYLVQFYAIEVCKQIVVIHNYYFICLFVIVLISATISFMILKISEHNRKLKVLYIC